MPLKSKLEIIEEIAAYYSEDTSRRGQREDGMCEYFTKDGKMCAVGYCLKNPQEAAGLEGGIGGVWGQEIKADKFKEEYQIDDEDFWDSLQLFHDSKENWDLKGLTEKGQSMLNLLKSSYAETPVT